MKLLCVFRDNRILLLISIRTFCVSLCTEYSLCLCKPEKHFFKLKDP